MAVCNVNQWMRNSAKFLSTESPKNSKVHLEFQKLVNSPSRIEQVHYLLIEPRTSLCPATELSGGLLRRRGHHHCYQRARSSLSVGWMAANCENWCCCRRFLNFSTIFYLTLRIWFHLFPTLCTSPLLVSLIWLASSWGPLVLWRHLLWFRGCLY
jgi:hypothetical protein